MSKNLKFGPICRTISILDKIVENSRFWSGSKKMVDFGDFGKKFKQISILVKIDKNLEFGQYLR